VSNRITSNELSAGNNIWLKLQYDVIIIIVRTMTTWSSVSLDLKELYTCVIIIIIIIIIADSAALPQNNGDH